MLFAADFLTETNEAVYHPMLGRIVLKWRDGTLYCEYAYNGVATLVGTQGPPTVEKIATLIEASYSRAHAPLGSFGTV